MGFSLKKFIAPAAAVVNPVAALGTAMQMGGDIYSARENARNVEKTNQTNKELGFATMAFNEREAEKGRLFSASQAKDQMDFQERMSNTSFQRSMEDMKKAGLNPMLAMDQGGASTPSGAMGSAPTASGSAPEVIPVPSVMAQVMSGAKDLIRLYTDVRQSAANTDAARASADAARAQAKKSGAEEKNITNRQQETQLDSKFYKMLNSLFDRLHRTGSRNWEKFRVIGENEKPLFGN